LPAIARRLEELPANTRVAAVVEVADPSARMECETAANLHIVWRYRSDSPYRGDALLQAVRDTYLPEGVQLLETRCAGRPRKPRRLMPRILSLYRGPLGRKDHSCTH
jgi:NADPH-dependent ferric siderophore reductase